MGGVWMGVHKGDPVGDYLIALKEKAINWATVLAEVHIADTHPPFAEARVRMVNAYSKLFELEQVLRIFTQARLEAIHGSAWWDKVHPDTRTQIEKREKEPLNLWFDDYSTSRLKYADFDGLRLTILLNWGDFGTLIGDRDTFQSNMVWLSHARNRVAHVNTLSGDDAQDFLNLAKRVLDVVTPHVQLR